jgi:hypothetical protein
MTRAHYEAETLIENRLDAPLKPIVGTNHGRKWPRFKTNDTSTPYWLGEVTRITHYLREQGVLSAIAERVRFARRLLTPLRGA